MRKIAFFLILFFNSISVWSQNPREDISVGINFIIGGPGFTTGVSFDGFITPSFNFEAGVSLGSAGLISGPAIYSGLKYHLFGSSNSHFTPYGGAFIVGTSAAKSIFKDRPRGVLYGYFPIGIQYIATKGFTFGVEIAYLLEPKEILFSNNQHGGWFGIKIGHHFKHY